MSKVGNVGNEPKELYVKGDDSQDVKNSGKASAKELNSAFTVQEPEVLELDYTEDKESNKKDASKLLGKLFDTLYNNKPIHQQNIVICSCPGTEPLGSPFRGENIKIQTDNLNEQGVQDLIKKFNEPKVDEQGILIQEETFETVTYKPGSFKKEGDVISFSVSYKDGLGRGYSYTYKFDSVTGEKLPPDLPKDFGILRDGVGNITGYEVKGSFDSYHLQPSSFPQGSVEYTEILDKKGQVTKRTMDFSKVEYDFVSMKGDIHGTGVIEYDFMKNKDMQSEENKPKKSLNIEG